MIDGEMMDITRGMSKTSARRIIFQIEMSQVSMRGQEILVTG
jgi:hypothetical protein